MLLTIVTVESKEHGSMLRYEKTTPLVRNLGNIAKELSVLLENYTCVPGEVTISIETVRQV